MKKFSLLVMLILSFSILAPGVLAASQAELEQQKKEAQDKAAAAQYQIDMTQTTIEGINSELEKSNSAISNLQAQMDTLNGQINTLNQSMQSTQGELDTLNVTLGQQQLGLEERLRVMYMYGNESYLEILFSSTGMTDFLTKIDMIASIMTADQKSVNQVKNTLSTIDTKNKELVSQRAAVELAKSEQQALLVGQENIKAQQQTLLAQNGGVLEAAREELATRNAEIAAAEAELSAIVRDTAGSVDTSPGPSEGGSDGGPSGGGSTSGDTGGTGGSGSGGGAATTGYRWPSDYYTITDYFGPRESPGEGASTNHMGIDIGAAFGSPIYAAASGRVTLARYAGGYGNCVIIAHDDGYSTLYAHQNELAVSAGEYVTQGQVIGYVGNTGASFGAHLHLSFMNSNGDFVNPLNFL
ncbi:murein hydrolase activator EnvC family protein [Eubacterium barkeri]|uniref:Murein DD-endopeptidase MepM and murein hydrolase activator NlpD, contain LysM domain n=2 Tax=Eubacterium TaxID=1730 RepID=A0A1H3BY49_EUBBA|nr:M23 family metallopeptidase [Eubacterium barkeri]SDX46628.1 Murein DD-endopeptidase MepM and murein hydrolase activator NlpD, contain LysM domain [Eubacterium barkeri]